MLETSNKSKFAIYWLIRKKREEYNKLISREEAAYLVALDMGIDIYQYIPKEKVDELRSLVLKVPTIKVIKGKVQESPKRKRREVSRH